MKQLTVNGVVYKYQGKKDLEHEFVKVRDISRERLQEIYDSIPGAKAVKRLRNRPYAIEAIWKAMPEVEGDADQKPRGNGDSKRGEVGSKLLAMLSKGATIEAIMEALGWQRHTVRGRISTLKSRGLDIETVREGKTTTYRVTA